MATEIFSEKPDAGLDEALRNMIRVGKVVAIKEKPLRVRVQYQDKGELVSHWLPCIVPRSLKDKVYDLYDIGEDVVCLHMPNGVQRGFVLGAYYPHGVELPKGSVDKWIRQFADGTTIMYDRNEHILSLDVKGPINIIAAGNINVIGDVIADGISLKHHVHSGIEPGPSNTGQPVK